MVLAGVATSHGQYLAVLRWAQEQQHRFIQQKQCLTVNDLAYPANLAPERIHQDLAERVAESHGRDSDSTGCDDTPAARDVTPLTAA